MKVLMAIRSHTLAPLVERGFRDAGAEVETLDLDELASWIPHGSRLREISQHFIGKDLVVYISDEMTFADSGGPYLRQVASWAESGCVPVIVVASTCRISTRELRSMGVEAGYKVATGEDVRRVVQTWAPRHVVPSRVE